MREIYKKGCNLLRNNVQLFAITLQGEQQVLYITYLYTEEKQKEILDAGKDNYEFSIQPLLASRENCLELAQRAEQEGSSLLVAPGFMADYLETQNLKIPLVKEVVTLSAFFGKLYEVTQDLKKSNPLLLLYPSWELTIQERKAMEDIFKVRLKQIELPEHEILNMQLDVERLEQMIHEERCDAVIAPRLFQKILGSLKVPLYQANFTPLAEEEIRLTLDHVNQILDIFRHQNTLNARTEMMLKQSFDAVFCLDEQGRIKLWNNYAETLFHLQGKSLLKEQIWDVLQIESSEVLKSSVENKSPLMGQPILVDEQAYAVSVFLYPESEEIIVHFSRLTSLKSMDQGYSQKAEKSGHVAKYHFSDIIGDSGFIKKAKEYARRFSGHNSSVLICGESGTGKELFAQSIHNESLRKNGPFVAINCSTIPASLMESELFGYAGGSFTGATKAGKKGYFEMADGGTIFLDEISELSFAAQAQLLRVLAEKTLMRVGDNTVHQIDIRVLAATNKNLMQMVREGKFRADLYYRLNVLSLEIEPLRKRKEDILPIFDYYFNKICQQEKKYLSITSEARQVLMEYSWPGNVRQLRNFCERIIVVSQKEILDKDFILSELQMAFSQDSELAESVEEKENGDTEQIKKICQALEQSKGKRKAAAELLGIHPSTLWRQMKKLGLEDKHF